MSRQYTRDEVRDLFLDHVRDLIAYWANVSSDCSHEQRLEGLAHSILAVIDGEGQLPAFAVIPSPHPDDKSYRQQEDMNWFPELKVELKNDIGGDLHQKLLEE